MWLKLTMYDGSIVRVNMNMVDSYLVTDENKAHTSISFGATAYQVKETCEQIDDAIKNTSSELRLVRGW